MSHGPLIFLGAFFTLALSWFGLVVEPQLQLGVSQPTNSVQPGDLYPQARPGEAQQGLQVYRSLGCVACHSQQVGPRNYSADLERGWGVRRSVAADYLFDHPVLLGSQRIGPDLANVGLWRPSGEWHLLHLYNPQTVMEPGRKSFMPPYPFLFETRKIGQRPSPDALKLTGQFAPETGLEVVPKPEARQLVAYLLSQRITAALFETPVPQPKTNAVAAVSTNSVGATNAPPK